MFQDFIDRWGTHVVKSANFGGRLQFIKTATDNGDVDISEFHQETQKTFEKLSANSYMKQTQDESSTDVSVAASASGSAGGPSGYGFLKYKDPRNLCIRILHFSKFVAPFNDFATKVMPNHYLNISTLHIQGIVLKESFLRFKFKNSFKTSMKASHTRITLFQPPNSLPNSTSTQIRPFPKLLQYQTTQRFS